MARNIEHFLMKYSSEILIIVGILIVTIFYLVLKSNGVYS